MMREVLARTSGAVRLLWWASTGHRGPMLRAALGIWLGLWLALSGLGVVEALQRGLEPLLQGEGAQLKVQPTRLKLGPVDLVGTLFQWRGLSTARLEALRGVPGVSRSWGEYWSRFPVGLSGSLLGQSLYSDGALLGLPGEAVESGLRASFRWREGERVPVLVPYSLFVAYNSGFAPANGFPRLTETALTGLRFNIVAGRSSFERSEQPPIKLEAEVLGLTRYGDALAAVVPAEVVGWLGQRLQLEQAEDATSARVVVAPGSDPAQVAEQLRGQGLGVEEVSGALRQLALALEVLRTGVRGLSGLVMGVALLLFLQLYELLLERRRVEWQLLWSQGVPMRLLRVGIWGELGLLLGGMGGVGLGTAQLLLAVGLPPLEGLLERGSGLELSLTGVVPWVFGLQLLGLCLLVAGARAQSKLRSLGTSEG